MDDDPVISEIDVFLSTTLASDMHLLQYPLRPTWRPYPPENLTDIRIKPSQQKVEMALMLDAERHLLNR